MIKSFLKLWLRNLLILIVFAYFYPGFYLKSNTEAYFLSSLFLTLIEFLLNPFLKTIVLPVRIITFGLFSWLTETLQLLILAYILQSVEFRSFFYQNFKILGITFDGGQINLLFSIIVGSIFYKFLKELVKAINS
ncbi:phage holin family protein [Candidatus Beckwithbacteria bacterium]|nr:phage holin family protein [Candidatus Beckwithbacteria bacterium]